MTLHAHSRTHKEIAHDEDYFQDNNRLNIGIAGHFVGFDCNQGLAGKLFLDRAQQCPNEAEAFLKRITTDTSMRQTLPRLSIPALLIYGAKDLKAPVEVGQSIYQDISTPESQKTLLILPNSRHGAEGNDVPLMQTAIKDFIDQTLISKR